MDRESGTGEEPAQLQDRRQGRPRKPEVGAQGAGRRRGVRGGACGPRTTSPVSLRGGAGCGDARRRKRRRRALGKRSPPPQRPAWGRPLARPCARTALGDAGSLWELAGWVSEPRVLLGLAWRWENPLLADVS